MEVKEYSIRVSIEYSFLDFILISSISFFYTRYFFIYLIIKYNYLFNVYDCF